MLTIITPCCRQTNLHAVYQSINFDKIDRWIIVYDTSRNRSYTHIFGAHPKIMEVECSHVGRCGHPQRNFGMNFVEDGFIYMVDDDNIIHPNFWNIVDKLDSNYFYTFDQARNKNGGILAGNCIKVAAIDTAMFIVHKKHIGTTQWIPDKYDADGYFISEIYAKHKIAHKYINEIGCYYNYLV